MRVVDDSSSVALASTTHAKIQFIPYDIDDFLPSDHAEDHCYKELDFSPGKSSLTHCVKSRLLLCIREWVFHLQPEEIIAGITALTFPGVRCPQVQESYWILSRGHLLQREGLRLLKYSLCARNQERGTSLKLQYGNLLPSKSFQDDKITQRCFLCEINLQFGKQFCIVRETIPTFYFSTKKA